MKTLPKQISLFTEEQLTYLPEDSPVNHTQWQASDLERKMSDTSGQRCLERFGKFSRHGLWAKTFSALLIGQEGWYSTKCRLIWKLKGTKYNRMYFQLAPSTLHIEETGFGLLPTITSVQRDHPERVEALKATGAKTMMSRNCGENRPNSILDHMNFYGMLPTPTAMDSTGATANMKSSQVKEGSMHSVTLSRWAGMLPTPTTRDYKGDRKLTEGENITAKGEKMGISLEQSARIMTGNIEATSSTSQLSPQFVLEMMGFPPDWTLLPFLSGETNQSKPEAMQ